MTLTKDNILSLLESSNQLRILVVGDVMLDEFHWCDVNRISPEAPVPICKINKTSIAPGGAANVASNLSALNVQVDLCGYIGNDTTGDKFIKNLQDHSIHTKGIIKTQQPTILKSRIIAAQQHVTRLDREPHKNFSESDHKALLHFIEANMQHYNLLIISDYLKGVFTPSSTQNIINIATKHNCTILIDPKGKDYTKYKNATFLTPNFAEFCEATNTEHSSEESIKRHGLSLINELKLKALIITRSEKGMTLLTPEQKIDLPTNAKEVFDITGAGDTVIACLGIGLSLGLSLIHAAKIANIAAGIVVSKLGTATTTIEALSNAIQNESF